MRCPYCGHLEDRVVDSREAQEGQTTRRRRECLGCARRFTTYERIEEVLPQVVKKDGRREAFDRARVSGASHPWRPTWRRVRYLRPGRRARRYLRNADRYKCGW